MTFTPRVFIGFLLVGLITQNSPAGDTEWKAGVAKVVITPSQPTWLSGYSSRTEPARGQVHELYAKAAAFESPDGTRLVLVTCDLGSMHPGITDAVAAEAKKRFALPPEQLVINVSHTHCAPEVAAERPVFHNLSAEEENKLAAYIRDELIPKLVSLVGSAIADLQPSRLMLGKSSAGFASNRRFPVENGFVNRQNPDGVVDHDVPVLRVLTPEGALRGVLFGYACHNTTLAFDRYCGDYAGFAQEYVESAHPGTVALFVMGCGGDQNPYPRHGPRGLEYCRAHGRKLADAVERAFQGDLTEMHAPLRVAYELVTLELEPLPPLARLENDAAGPEGHRKRKARYLLTQLKETGTIQLTQTCPVQAARFGDDLLFVFLGGETVVDYSLKAKAEFAGPLVWVAGYCNDVFAYLPSLRVLREGGYEGRTGIIHQLVPTPFAPSFEEKVMGAVRRVVAEVAR